MPEVEAGNGSEQWKPSNTSSVFVVRESGTLVGRLQVSTGGIRWWKGKAQNQTQFVQWDDLVAFLEGAPG